MSVKVSPCLRDISCNDKQPPILRNYFLLKYPADCGGDPRSGKSAEPETVKRNELDNDIIKP